MAYVDVMAQGTLSSNIRNGNQCGYKVTTPTGVEYTFGIIANVLVWSKSTNEGFSWTLPVAVSAGSEQMVGFCVWYDKWTPGNTGTIIHIWYTDAFNDDVIYRALDTADDSLGTATVAFAGASTGAAANTCITGARMIGGNLLVVGDIDGGTEVFVSRSVDAGANWTARATSGGPEGSDYYAIAPGFALDTNDAIMIFWDRSASEISRKLYDDSGDAWSETSIATSMAAVASSVCTPDFSIAVDDARNKIILVAWSARDAVNADLRFWSIDESSITEGTNVVLNSGGNQQMCAVSLDTDTADIYVFYGGASDGSENPGTSINIYYKVSTDDGATWGSETKLTVSARNLDVLFSSLIFQSTTAPQSAYYVESSATIINMLYSALLPSGGGLTTPMFSGGVIQ